MAPVRPRTRPNGRDRRAGQSKQPDGSGGSGQNRYFVESLARGLAVLAAFAPQRPELSLSEIAEVAGVTNPSALRIGYTLVTLGYLTRTPITRGYRLGPAVLTLGMASLSSMSLLELAEPYLRQLRDATGETVKLAVLHDTEMVYVARFPSLIYPAAGSTYVGSRLPAPQTCTGRAILSRLPEAEARSIVERSRFQRFTERSLTDPEEIMAEIRRSRERGYAVNDQGTTIEHRSAAVALTNAHGEPVGAINVSVSVQRVSRKDLETRLVPRVRETAARISALLPGDLQNGLRPGGSERSDRRGASAVEA